MNMMCILNLGAHGLYVLLFILSCLRICWGHNEKLELVQSVTDFTPQSPGIYNEQSHSGIGLFELHSFPFSVIVPVLHIHSPVI